MSTPPRPQARHYSPVPSASGSARNASPGHRRLVGDRASSLASTNKIVTADDPAPTERPASTSSSSSEDPDNTCAICLGKPSNKSFTDSCYHPFCFNCLLEWSKVKAICPLCQKPFRTIVHTIKANYEFEQYHIFQNFRPGSTGNRPISMANDRRGVYELGYYARPSVSRYREVSAEFFQNNPAQTHRLIPWLNRELLAILAPPHSLTLVLDLTMTMIARVDIRSAEMRQVLDLYLSPYTEHFQHELFCFASSPHDITTFDRYAEYDYRPPICYSEAIARIQRALERDGLQGSLLLANQSVTSALLTDGRSGRNFSAFRPWASQAGTSRQTNANSPQPSTSGTQNARITYYVDSSSDEDDCQVVKVIKPFRERTPILIDLCDSESGTETIPADDPVSDSPDEEIEPERKPPAGSPAARPKSVIGAYYPGPSRTKHSSNSSNHSGASSSASAESSKLKKKHKSSRSNPDRSPKAKRQK